MSETPQNFQDEVDLALQEAKDEILQSRAEVLAAAVTDGKLSPKEAFYEMKWLEEKLRGK